MATKEEASQAIIPARKELTAHGARVIAIGILQNPEGSGNFVVEADIARTVSGLPTKINGVSVKIVDLQIPTRDKTRSEVREYLRNKGYYTASQ